MTGRKWLVTHRGHPSAYKWAAIEPRHRDLLGHHGPICNCMAFATFHEAITYATRIRGGAS